MSIYTITEVCINYDPSTNEYRVPGSDRSTVEREEDTCYYTDDRDDAIGTARCMYPAVTSIRITNIESYAEERVQ